MNNKYVECSHVSNLHRSVISFSCHFRTFPVAVCLGKTLKSSMQKCASQSNDLQIAQCNKSEKPNLE